MDEPPFQPDEHGTDPPVPMGDATAAPALPPADPWATFDRWAGWFCLGLALVSGLTGLLVIGPALVGEVHPVLAASLIAIIVGEVVLLYAVSAGLGRGLAWARPAALWVLWLAVATGLGGAALDLTHSKVTIPLGAILGAVVLARAPARVPSGTRQDTRRAALVGVVLVVLMVLPAALGFVATDAASPLVAKADDLAVVMDVACRGDGTAMPDRIDVRLSWTWRDRDVFPGRPDTVGIGWPTDDGRESMFVLYDSSTSGPTLVPGGDGLSSAAVDTALLGGRGWTWSVGEVGQTEQDGWVTVRLIPTLDDPRVRPADGSVRVEGIYAHLDRWTVRTEGRCGWGAEAKVTER